MMTPTTIRDTLPRVRSDGSDTPMIQDMTSVTTGIVAWTRQSGA